MTGEGPDAAGHVDDATYRRRADLHRPHAGALRAEVLRLWFGGLTARDISVALRLPESEVQTWVAGASS